MTEQIHQLANNMTPAKATICVVNYKTLDMTRLCLRSIRKYTRYPYEVIVVDNDSRDESLEYLKTLNWIRLIERQAEPNEPAGSYAHATALDLGLANCKTEFFIAMHSDTIIIRPGWLSELMQYFENDNSIVCLGSGKIELVPQWRIILKQVTDFRTFMRKLFGPPDTVGEHRYYNRTICCIYRTDILKREGLSFLMGREQGLTTGQKLYFELLDRGYKTVELPSWVMKKYLLHLAHVTQAVNPQEFTLRKRTLRKFNRLMAKIMSDERIQQILNDDSLDK